ncbi:MAG: hypothetical protein HC817_14540 [Saprospiraceae bacterium]|nr:hypothetical protein [Saprospiraceae bacterium]
MEILDEKPKKPHHNMTILGSGCASLQLLYQLSKQPFWKNTSVTLLSNDFGLHRSWCFWAKQPSAFQHLVTKSWSNVTFKSADFTMTENIFPYQYHYVKGEHFFQFFDNKFLPNQTNIKVERAQIQAVKKEDNQFELCSGEANWATDRLFSSIEPIDFTQARFKLWQHFKGWFVKTDSPVFDDSTVILMDFSIPQQDSVRFIYLLPFRRMKPL